MSYFCQIEYAASGSDVGMPCGKIAVARCADCGTTICSCCIECCGQRQTAMFGADQFDTIYIFLCYYFLFLVASLASAARLSFSYREMLLG